MLSQELCAIDQWSKQLLLVVCSYDGHTSNVSVNFVTFACCILYFC